MALSPKKRSTVQHLVNVTTAWDNKNGAANFQLINEGVTDLTEDLNPETDDLQYVAEDEKTHVVKTYAPAITLSAVMVDPEKDKVNEWMQKVINKLPKGDEADTAYIRFNVLKDLATAQEQADGKHKYEAYKRDAVVEASSIGGAAGDNVEMEVTISGKGEAKKGILTIDKSGTTPTYDFTPDSTTTTNTPSGQSLEEDTYSLR